MKKMLLIAITSFSFWGYTNEVYYTPDKNFPLEFVYLINSIQSKKLAESDLALLKKQIKSLDLLAEQLELEKMHFFVKSEIYKILLKFRPKNEINLESYKEQILLSAKNKLNEDSKKELSPFSSWFIEALLTDINQLFKSEIFKQVQNAIYTKQPLKNDKERIFKKKLDMILAWVELYQNLNAEEFEMTVTSLMLKVIDKLQLNGILYMKINNSSTVSGTDTLAHFSTTEKAPDKKGIAQINYILDLENMGLDKDRQKEPKLEWLPKDEPDNVTYPDYNSNNAPKDKTSKPPEPINDWPIDIE